MISKTMQVMISKTMSHLQQAKPSNAAMSCACTIYKIQPGLVATMEHVETPGFFYPIHYGH